jgi:hypothetical protein
LRIVARGFDFAQGISLWEPTMQNAVMGFVLGMSILLAATCASALEGQFNRPMYKNLARLDNCQHFGKFCGQPAADDFCRIMGYERATRFDTEHASPTRVINFGQECTGSVCVAFKSIVCFTRAQQRGKVLDWPHRID